MGIRNFDLSAFVRNETELRSREQWIEARYHWSRTEVALRWQQYAGSSSSIYGFVPLSCRAEVLLRAFL
jgi:hypothetical protein